MPSKQFARGLFAGFGTVENPFQVPNGMEENLRAIDDHLWRYTVDEPLPPEQPYPADAVNGDGQIYIDGTYAIYNGGAWKRYPSAKGISFAQLNGPIWTNTGTGWQIGASIHSVDTIAQLRALPGLFYGLALVTDYYGNGKGGGGPFVRRHFVAPSGWENGGTQIVANDGAGWERIHRGTVFLRDFGAVMDYRNGLGTDDSQALANAFSAMAECNGTVCVDTNGISYIANFSGVPAGVTLSGPFKTADSMLSMKDNPISILGLGGGIALNSMATILLRGGGTVDGVLIYRAGISIPSADASAFAGTAFTIGGPGASLRNVLAVGFDKLVESNGYERIKMDWFFGDGQSGIDMADSRDVARLSHVHLWPFATFTPNAPLTAHYRTGIGFHIHDDVDAAFLFDCFSYGHATRFHFENVSTVRWIGCMGDGDRNQAGSIGLKLTGNINGFLGSSNALWSSERGVVCQMNSGQWVDLTEIKFDGCPVAAIDLIGGGVDVSDCQFDNVGSCMRVVNRDVQAVFDRNQYAGVARDVIECVMAGTTNIFIGPGNIDANNTAGGALNNSNLSIPGIEVASTIPLNPNYNEYFLFGEGQVDDIVGGWKGRTVIFRFTGSQKMSSSTGSRTKVRLSGNATYTGSIGSTLVLYHDGSQFYQIGGVA